MEYICRLSSEKDWEQIKYIYEAGIATGSATFETSAPSSYEKWISKADQFCTFIIYHGELVLGWCRLCPVSDRAVYAGVGEVGIYVHPKAIGMGIGNKLLQTLITKSEEQGYWMLQASIFPENKASIELHKKNGFRVVGHRERIGRLNNKWRDNYFLERRSSKVGQE